MKNQLEIINLSKKIFGSSSKKLEEEFLDSLNKTFKKNLKQKPTRL